MDPGALLQDDDLRLRAVALPQDAAVALPWSQDPEVMWLSEGEVGARYDEGTVSKMYRYLLERGETYIIEMRRPEGWLAIGAVRRPHPARDRPAAVSLAATGLPRPAAAGRARSGAALEPHRRERGLHLQSPCPPAVRGRGISNGRAAHGQGRARAVDLRAAAQPPAVGRPQVRVAAPPGAASAVPDPGWAGPATRWLGARRRCPHRHHARREDGRAPRAKPSCGGAAARRPREAGACP